MGSVNPEVAHVKIIQPPYKTRVCDIAESTLLHSLTSGENALVAGDSLLIKTYGKKALAVGIERRKVNGGEIKPGTWYRLHNPPGLARTIQDEFASGNRRLEFVRGTTEWELVRDVRDYEDWESMTRRRIISRRDFMDRAEETAALIKAEYEIVVVDLSQGVSAEEWQVDTVLGSVELKSLPETSPEARGRSFFRRFLEGKIF